MTKDCEFASCHIEFLGVNSDIGDYLDDDNIFDANNNQTLFQSMLGHENTPAHSKLLQCNKAMISDLEQRQSCCDTTLSSLLLESNNSKEGITVPCGTCVIVDQKQGETLELPNGLLIEGMLYFPPSANLTIHTTHVFVMGGILKMDGIMNTAAPVSSSEPRTKVTFHLYGEDEVTFQTKTEHEDDLPTCINGCNFGAKPVAVVGGRLEIQSLPSPCPTWEKLYGVASSMSTLIYNKEDIIYDRLIVSPQAAACWGRPGMELVLTSHTAQDSDRQVVVVDKLLITYSEDSDRQVVVVDKLLANNVISLSVPLRANPMTQLEHGEFGVEVASLSRPIVFRADDHPMDNLIGGHLIVYWTSTLQHIEGIEFVNFGQQGRLGKYPLHFHFCYNAAGSVVKKNVVRESNQRCYVIHQSDKILIEDNISLDSFGHCYFLEDGVETNNVFRKNLGLGVKKSTRLLSGLSGREETDDEPSVFWISNPQNYFYGNIAAGSERFGYWIEARGAASTLNLKAFDNNEVHSTDTGFSPYPMFWYPYDVNIITNLKVYRNRVGLFLHNTVLLTFDHLVLADNAIPAWVLTADSIVFRNTKVIGRISEDVECPEVGIWLHPVKRGDKHTNFRERFRTDTYFSNLIGSTLENVEFSNWSGCYGAPQIQFFAHNHYSNDVYNNPHIFRNITFDGSDEEEEEDDTGMDTIVDNCPSSDFTIVEVQSDPTGTISPTHEPGFLISSDLVNIANGNVVDLISACIFVRHEPGFLISSDLVNIADSECRRFNQCLHFCEGACMRSLRIFTNPVAKDYDMVVTPTVSATDETAMNRNNNTFSHILRVQRSGYGKHASPIKATSFGAYGLALPSGSFRIHFENDDGTIVFPDYAVPIFERAPQYCENYIGFDGRDITIVRPEISVDCYDLTHNGSFENGVEGWQSLNGDINWEGSSKSLRAVRPSQYIKSQCVVSNRTYKFDMSFSVLHTNTKNYQGSMFLRLYSFNIATGYFEERTVLVARAEEKEDDEGKYVFSGEWTPTEEDAMADKIELILLDHSFEDLQIHYVSAVWKDSPPLEVPNQQPQHINLPSTAPLSTALVSVAPVSSSPVSSAPVSFAPVTMSPVSNTIMPSTTIASSYQNLALKKTTLQSSTSLPYVASNAVDGDMSTMIHTSALMDNWWLVDLETVCMIQQIVIYNRQDCCQERLEGAIVTVLDEMMETVVLERVITKVAPTVVELNFDDNMVEGRYVRISLDKAYLNLNEVEVYGYYAL
eukprot:CAMPEP_0194161270 /NCGR_PEP_ID=MMETSP0152-20130528/78848_1 /TAXON_ID=1049557 /ORGANISM="Thalassiothrix antarctica, Strain L6-D1" /LENGTH=1250 /DNA_ID=CAMNT_0038871045 /DNA_START=70 /DNA_END=3824 /DNA_ORIENTATION=-